MSYITIRDLLKTGEAEIVTGPFGTQLKASEYQTNGIPVLNVKNLGYGNVVMSKIDKVGEKTLERLKRHMLHAGDIVFGRKGAVDRHAFISNKEDGWMQGSDCIRLRILSDRYNPRFLSYFFLTEMHRSFMISMCSHGTTMASLNQGILEHIAIPEIDRVNQDNIVSILSSLDDKIELNNQINVNLQQQAQAIYQHMFGITEDRPANGALSDICSLSTEKVDVSKLGLENYYSTENMLPNKGGAVAATALPSIAQTTKCRPGDTLISNIRPYFKKILYCTKEGGCSTDVLCFRPKEPEFAAFLYNTLYSDRFFDYMMAGAKGTKMPRGDKQQMLNYSIYLPHKDGLSSFAEFSSGILGYINNANIENGYLRIMRDGLLDKLII